MYTKKKCSACWIRSEVLRTCVTAQQRLVGEMVDKIVEGGELVEAEHVAAVFARHVEMLDGILRPVSHDNQTTRNVALLKCTEKDAVIKVNITTLHFAVKSAIWVTQTQLKGRWQVFWFEIVFSLGDGLTLNSAWLWKAAVYFVCNLAIK